MQFSPQISGVPFLTARLWQHRIIIVVRLRSQIYSAFTSVAQPAIVRCCLMFFLELVYIVAYFSSFVKWFLIFFSGNFCIIPCGRIFARKNALGRLCQRAYFSISFREHIFMLILVYLVHKFALFKLFKLGHILVGVHTVLVNLNKAHRDV